MDGGIGLSANAIPKIRQCNECRRIVYSSTTHCKTSRSGVIYHCGSMRVVRYPSQEQVDEANSSGGMQYRR